MPETNERDAATEATVRAGAPDGSFRARLIAIADEDRRLNGRLADAIDRFVDRLQQAEAGVAAPKVGDSLPDFLLPDRDGRLIALATLVADGPVVVVFLRGHWCPYCVTTASALGDTKDAAADRGARIVAISPESQKYSRRIAPGANEKFSILADVDNGYALSLNLAICVDATLAALIAEDGAQIPGHEPGGILVLPIPATFIIDRQGRITARYVNVDFRTRMDPEEILAALDRLA